MALNDAFTAGQILTSMEMNNLPFGRCGYASITSNQTGIGGSATDVTSLSVTWTAVSSRYYKLSAAVILEQQTSTGLVQVQITTSGNTAVAVWYEGIGSSQRAVASPFVVLTGLSGSVTYKIRATTSSDTVNVLASATAPSVFLVEDIGST